jgi:predicted HicB family RNase H-like nuclease
MSAMHYKGYYARIEFDAHDAIFVGHIAGINDVIGFHADNVADLKAAFHEAVDDYVETCEKIGKPPEKPFSGNMMFRVDPTLHAKAALAAELTGKSLNQWGEETIAEALSRAEPASHVERAPVTLRSRLTTDAGKQTPRTAKRKPKALRT